MPTHLHLRVTSALLQRKSRQPAVGLWMASGSLHRPKTLSGHSHQGITGRCRKKSTFTVPYHIKSYQYHIHLWVTIKQPAVGSDRRRHTPVVPVQGRLDVATKHPSRHFSTDLTMRSVGRPREDRLHHCLFRDLSHDFGHIVMVSSNHSTLQRGAFLFNFVGENVRSVNILTSEKRM